MNLRLFKVFDFKFVLQIYADEIKADYDNSKLLSAKEAFYLAIALFFVVIVHIYLIHLY